MLQLLASIRNFFSLVSGIFLPMFYRGSRALSSAGRTLLWVLHFILLFVILGVLTYVNQKYIKRNLTDIPLVNTIWLPALFLVFYVLIWIIWKLIQVLAMEPDPSDFPDIDDAWDEAMAALDKAGVGITDAPIFLVLGKPAAGEEGIFAAADRKFVVAGSPNRNAPIHVYANRDEIYITCAGTSLLGQQVGFFEGVVPAYLSSSSSSGTDASGGGGGGTATARPEDFEAAKKIQEYLASLQRPIHELTEEERQTLRRLEQEGEAKSSVRRTYLHTFPEEVQRTTARLQHLCHLITREREPYCPINGVVVLLPLTGTECQDDASEVGSCLEDDLKTIRETLRVNCPILTLLCDLERLTGFREFIASMARSQLRQRMGQRFPYLPDIKLDQLAGMIEGGIQWIGQSLFASFAYTLLRLESPSTCDYSQAVRSNVRVFRFVAELRERQKQLGHILSRAFGNTDDAPPMFGGCYLAGTGRDPLTEQAFIVGVFERPVKDQELVSWTDDALAEDAACNMWAKIGWGILCVVVLGMVAGAYLYFKSKNS